MRVAIAVLALGLTKSGLAQTPNLQESLSTAIAKYQDLSLFNGLLQAMPTLLGEVLGSKDQDLTILVPSNAAVSSFLKDSGISDPATVPLEKLKYVLQYHVVDASLKTKDFEAPRGLTVPTILKDTLYNNRTAGPGLASKYGDDATGQVVYFSEGPIAATKLKSRQTEGPTANLRGGLGQVAKVTAIDGVWGPDNKNSFQVVDKILTPPGLCSATIRNAGDALKSLDNALNRTSLWSTLDNLKNVTCLAPNSGAFAKAGNADSVLSKEDLTGALVFHTLPQVTYTDYLEDGMEFTSLANKTVKVKIQGDDIYFNNAKVVAANVLTNNGLIHILDAVMAEDDDDKDNKPSTTSGSSPSPTGGSSPTTSTPGAGSALSVNAAAVVGLAAVVALL